MSFELKSAAFAAGAVIPRKYTCDGQDISPPLQWSDPPAAAGSFALVCDDPDAPAGTWIHWVIYNIPAAAHALPERVVNDAALPDGSRQGRNSWGNTGYGGPCPPRGQHRYYFKLYALDKMLDLASGAGRDQLLKAMQGHIVAQAELMGVYSRS